MNKIIDPSVKSIEEENIEISLRPTNLDDYIGQTDLVNNLKVFIGAAKKRNEVLDHILLYGPPGLGKTTLAYVVSNEMGTNIKVVNGPTLEKPGDLASILSSLRPGDILFIDEIHRIPKQVEEILYGAMEDYSLTLVVGKDESAKSITIDLPPFTLFGATTKQALLSQPLRDRFGIVSRLNYYSIEELTKIVIRTSKVFYMNISEESARLIALRSRGTPRIANRIFRRIRDFADYEDKSYIDENIINKALNLLKIDSLGLDEIDNSYIRILIERFNGGPVGIDSIASSIGEEKNNLEDMYEPYLLKLGLIDKTPRGRIITSLGIKHYKSIK